MLVSKRCHLPARSVLGSWPASRPALIALACWPASDSGRRLPLAVTLLLRHAGITIIPILDTPTLCHTICMHQRGLLLIIADLPAATAGRAGLARLKHDVGGVSTAGGQIVAVSRVTPRPSVLEAPICRESIAGNTDPRR